MTRAIAILSCFIAALFLVPVQAECIEAAECESEAETECYVVVCTPARSVEDDQLPDYPAPLMTGFRQKYSLPKTVDTPIHIPARILHCVFRE